MREVPEQHGTEGMPCNIPTDETAVVLAADSWSRREYGLKHLMKSAQLLKEEVNCRGDRGEKVLKPPVKRFK